MATTNKPAAMTIDQIFKRLATILKAATPEERDDFKKTWLASLVDFNTRTEKIRFENWKRS